MQAKITICLIILLTTVGADCDSISNNIPQEETDTIPEKAPTTYVDTYTNTAFGYTFDLPEGAKVLTKEAVLYPIEHNEAIVIYVKFDDGDASLSSMREPDTFPEIRGLENLTAEDYVNKWWLDNKNDTNPNTTITISDVFKKKNNNIEWFGFTVDGALVTHSKTAKVSEGFLHSPQTIFITKKDDTFYRWKFDSEYEEQLIEVLNTFRFNN